jgi:ABC-2 type transport system ATP-binding protein
MKQKLGLCCALIHEPDILLLDEPTFGVDPISRRDLWLILHQMVESGMTVVVTTSYMDEAERCDRVALLDGGRVLALDTPSSIQSRLRGRLLAVRGPEPRRLRDALRSSGMVTRASLFGDVIHVVTDSGVAPAELHAHMRDAGIEAESVETAMPSLEDAFIDLVQSGR